MGQPQVTINEPGILSATNLDAILSMIDAVSKSNDKYQRRWTEYGSNDPRAVSAGEVLRQDLAFLREFLYLADPRTIGEPA